MHGIIILFSFLFTVGGLIAFLYRKEYIVDAKESTETNLPEEPKIIINEKQTQEITDAVDIKFLVKSHQYILDKEIQQLKDTITLNRALSSETFPEIGYNLDDLLTLKQLLNKKYE